MIQNHISAKQTELSTEQLRDLIVRGMQERKAQDIVVMDLRHVKNAITDFFVICSGNSDTQIDAIAGSIEEEILKVSRVFPLNREGKANREWILLDYIDVVAHVFKKERRAFYDLEQLWGDAEITRFDDNAPVLTVSLTA
jgi:ribosome-associated protein